MTPGPLCFVLMPFGTKPDPAGGPAIDFDAVYHGAIKPGILAADMEPIRADEEEVGGIIHKAMFERLLMCDFAVADLTTANPNVLYELGIRHAARPRTTLTVFAAQKPLPFDVNLLRSAPYELGPDNALTAAAAAATQDRIAANLGSLRDLARGEASTDSPLFQLVQSWRPDLPSPATAESFVAQVRATEDVNRRLRDIKAAAHVESRRDEARRRLAQVRDELLADDVADRSVLINLMLAFRALEDWSGMLEVHERLPATLARQPAVRQQVAFALNRRAEREGDPADRDRALEILGELEASQGPTTETCGLLGRVYKSQWREAVAQGAPARGFLSRAIGAYTRGFETDWRDVYPGVNAVTLLDIQGTAESVRSRDRLLPVVQFAAEQRSRSATADYWDWASLLELAVVAGDRDGARTALDNALAASPEPWQAESTADNLAMIARARRERGEPVDWIEEVVVELDPERAAGQEAAGATGG